VTLRDELGVRDLQRCALVADLLAWSCDLANHSPCLIELPGYGTGSKHVVHSDVQAVLYAA
jgi:hypothetical protein